MGEPASAGVARLDQPHHRLLYRGRRGGAGEVRCPGIFNTDQGSQFTSAEFTALLKANSIAISMDGKGCWRDNVFVERLWKSIKYEEVYLHAYESVSAAKTGIGRYISFYNSSSYCPTSLCH